MSYTLNVKFSGLCAFVPDTPFADGAPARAQVFLPNGMKPKPLTFDSKILDPHYPLLEFAQDQLDPNSPRQADLRRAADGRGACVLAGEDVWFDLKLEAQSKAGLTISEKNSDEAAPDDSLFWLAKLENASPGVYLDPSLLDGPKLTPDFPIAARVSFDQGLLKVSGRTERDCEFHPSRPGDPQYKQRIATELTLEIGGLSEPPVIVTQKPGQPSRKLMFNPGLSSYEVRIHNTELDDYLGIPNDMRRVEEVPDFEIYYDLVVGTGTFNRRFPKQPPPTDPGPSSRNPSLCPPGELRKTPPSGGVT